MKKLLTERFQELAGIKPLYEADPEAIKGKHYPDEETVKKLKKGPYTPGGQNAHTDEGEDLTFEPEDMDNPDEDLVIIGSGYLEILTKNNRPNMTNDELAAIGKTVVNGDYGGNQEAAFDDIMSQINSEDEEDEM